MFVYVTYETSSIQPSVHYQPRTNNIAVGKKRSVQTTTLGDDRITVSIKVAIVAIRILCAGKGNNLFETVKESLTGIECEVAKSTSVALALFLAQKCFPCVILCEPELVEGSPQELFNAMQEEPDLQPIPFFIVQNQAGQSVDHELPSVTITTNEEMRNWVRPFLVEIEDNRPEETSE